MSVLLIFGIALLTYGSRALALVLMPDPPDRLKAILDRIPAPLFAGLAITALIDEGSVAPPATLVAAGCALLASPSRSMLGVLVAGIAGFGLGVLFFG